MLVDHRELYQLRTVDDLIVRQIESVIGASQEAVGIGNRKGRVCTPHLTYQIVALLLPQRVEWGGLHPSTDGFDNAIFGDEDGHMVYQKILFLCFYVTMQVLRIFSSEF